MHIHLEKPSLTECPQCKEKKIMHAVCKSCGFYKGKEVIDTLKKEKDQKETKAKEKEEKKKPLSMEGLSKE